MIITLTETYLEREKLEVDYSLKKSLSPFSRVGRSKRF